MGLARNDGSPLPQLSKKLGRQTHGRGQNGTMATGQVGALKYSSTNIPWNIHEVPALRKACDLSHH